MKDKDKDTYSVQRYAKRGLSISLPLPWAAHYAIIPKDSIRIVENKDGSLTLIPLKGSK